MKTTTGFLTKILLAAVLLAMPCNCLAVKTGQQAPDFTLNTLQGEHVRLNTLRGKVVVAHFWSTTCAPCVAELPALNSAYESLKAEGLVVLGISIDPSAAPVRELANRLGLRFPILLDSDRGIYFDSYSLFGLPATVIVDRNGVVREKIPGAIDWKSPLTNTKLKTYLKGR